MRSEAPGKEDLRLRRKAAAFRLKHDLGKYIRFNAPATGTQGEEKEKDSAKKGKEETGKNREISAKGKRKKEDVEELRARLQLDLLSTRRRGSTAQSAVDVFFEWKKEEARVFEEAPPDVEALSTTSELEARVESLRCLLPSLFTFEEKQLCDLDQLSVEVHCLCLRLWKQTLLVSSSVSSEVP